MSPNANMDSWGPRIKLIGWVWRRNGIVVVAMAFSLGLTFSLYSVMDTAVLSSISSPLSADLSEVPWDIKFRGPLGGRQGIERTILGISDVQKLEIVDTYFFSELVLERQLNNRSVELDKIAFLGIDFDLTARYHDFLSWNNEPQAIQNLDGFYALCPEGLDWWENICDLSGNWRICGQSASSACANLTLTGNGVADLAFLNPLQIANRDLILVGTLTNTRELMLRLTEGEVENLGYAQYLITLDRNEMLATGSPSGMISWVEAKLSETRGALLGYEVRAIEAPTTKLLKKYERMAGSLETTYTQLSLPLLFAGIIIINISVSVYLDRLRRYLALMKVKGFGNAQIMAMLVLTSLPVAFLGGLTALAVGNFLHELGQLPRLTETFNLDTTPLTMLGCTVLLILFMCIHYRRKFWEAGPIDRLDETDDGTYVESRAKGKPLLFIILILIALVSVLFVVFLWESDFTGIPGVPGVILRFLAGLLHFLYSLAPFLLIFGMSMLLSQRGGPAAAWLLNIFPKKESSQLLLAQRHLSRMNVSPNLVLLLIVVISSFLLVGGVSSAYSGYRNLWWRAHYPWDIRLDVVPQWTKTTLRSTESGELVEVLRVVSNLSYDNVTEISHPSIASMAPILTMVSTEAGPTSVLPVLFETSKLNPSTFPDIAPVGESLDFAGLGNTSDGVWITPELARLYDLRIGDIVPIQVLNAKPYTTINCTVLDVVDHPAILNQFDPSFAADVNILEGVVDLNKIRLSTIWISIQPGCDIELVKAFLRDQLGGHIAQLKTSDELKRSIAWRNDSLKEFLDMVFPALCLVMTGGIALVSSSVTQSRILSHRLLWARGMSPSLILQTNILQTATILLIGGAAGLGTGLLSLLAFERIVIWDPAVQMGPLQFLDGSPFVWVTVALIVSLAVSSIVTGHFVNGRNLSIEYGRQRNR